MPSGFVGMYLRVLLSSMVAPPPSSRIQPCLHDGDTFCTITECAPKSSACCCCLTHSSDQCCKLRVYLSARSKSGTLQVAEFDDADPFLLHAAGAQSRGLQYVYACVCYINALFGTGWMRWHSFLHLALRQCSCTTSKQVSALTSPTGNVQLRIKRGACNGW